MAGETFKTLEEITKADPRSECWAVVDHARGTTRPLTLGDVRADLDQLELSPRVPQHIREHFLIARHLALYSWFVFPFHMPAQMQALASVEYALRERFAELGYPVPSRLRNQLEYAVSHGFLRNEYFRDWPGHHVEQEGADWDWLNSWAARVPEIMGYFRNEVAHGTFSVFPSGIAMRFAADVINQLYDPDASMSVAPRER